MEEDALKNSGRKLHEVVARGVEGVSHGHELVLRFIRFKQMFTSSRMLGNTKEGSITVLLTSCLTVLELAV